jgi:hypothetical protein
MIPSDPISSHEASTHLENIAGHREDGVEDISAERYIKATVRASAHTRCQLTCRGQVQVQVHAYEP